MNMHVATSSAQYICFVLVLHTAARARMCQGWHIALLECPITAYTHLTILSILKTRSKHVILPEK
jgi:hypothetical protein